MIPLAVLYWQALATLAEEIANSSIPQGSRKINGKYIQSHLFSRLQGTIMELFLCQINSIFCLG